MAVDELIDLNFLDYTNLGDFACDSIISANSNECKYITESENSTFLSSDAGMLKSGSRNHPVTLLHVNIRSLQANFDSLNNLLITSQSKYSIIALTETWLTDMNSD